MAVETDVQTAQQAARQETDFWNKLDERLGLSGLAYPVPEHANSLPYLLGGVTLFGFIVLIITGVLLAQFYHPHPANAHDSVIYIVTQVPIGDLIRSLHFWTANLVVVTAMLHLIRVFTTGSYKRPREANWLVGVGLLAVILGFVFTGTVLKWDQESVEALAHNREIGELLGLWGRIHPQCAHPHPALPGPCDPAAGRLYPAHHRPHLPDQAARHLAEGH